MHGEAGVMQAGSAWVVAGREAMLLHGVLDALPDAVAVAVGGRVVHVNEAFSRLFGYERRECVGYVLDELVIPDGRLHESEMLMYTLRVRGRTTMETVRRAAGGRLVEVSVMLSTMRLADGESALFALYRDIGRQKEEEKRLQHSTLHDGLTGLANRALFVDRLRLTLARLKRRPDRGFAVMYLDLDGFKKVNDTMGHAAGDAVLREAGLRLRRCVRPQDTVARLGGDEFALLLDETESVAEVGRVADRIQVEVQRAVVGEGWEAGVGASIGIALVGAEVEEWETILVRADRAMYAAKTGGKGRYVVWGDDARVAV